MSRTKKIILGILGIGIASAAGVVVIDSEKTWEEEKTEVRELSDKQVEAEYEKEYGSDLVTWIKGNGTKVVIPRSQQERESRVSREELEKGLIEKRKHDRCVIDDSLPECLEELSTQ